MKILSNSSLQIATTQCDDTHLLCLVVRFVHFLTGDRAVLTSVLVQKAFSSVIPWGLLSTRLCFTDIPWSHSYTNIPKDVSGRSQEVTTKVNGDPLRLIQEGLEGFLHSLSRKKWTAGKESCYHLLKILSNSSLQLATTQCDDAYLHMPTLSYRPLCAFVTRDDRAVIHVCACAQTFSLLYTLHKHPEA